MFTAICITLWAMCAVVVCLFFMGAAKLDTPNPGPPRSRAPYILSRSVPKTLMGETMLRAHHRKKPERLHEFLGGRK